MDWIGMGVQDWNIDMTHRGSDWTESVSLWIGLDWILQNGPTCNLLIWLP